MALAGGTGAGAGAGKYRQFEKVDKDGAATKAVLRGGVLIVPYHSEAEARAQLARLGSRLLAAQLRQRAAAESAAAEQRNKALYARSKTWTERTRPAWAGAGSYVESVADGYYTADATAQRGKCEVLVRRSVQRVITQDSAQPQRNRTWLCTRRSQLAGKFPSSEARECYVQAGPWLIAVHAEFITNPDKITQAGRLTLKPRPVYSTQPLLDALLGEITTERAPAMAVTARCEHSNFPAAARQITLNTEADILQISGTVIDQQSKRPIAGAKITVPFGGKNYSVSSLGNGTFTLTIPVRRGRTVQKIPLNFALATRMIKLRLVWRASASGMTQTKTEEYLIPENLYSLVIRGRVLGPDGRPIPGAAVTAEGPAGTGRTNAQEGGAFAMDYVRRRSGLPRRWWPHEIVFRLRPTAPPGRPTMPPGRPTVPPVLPPPPPVAPPVGGTGNLLTEYAGVLRAADDVLSAAALARLEQFLGVGNVYQALAANKPLPATTRQRLAVVLTREVDDRAYLVGRKVLGRIAPGPGAAAEAAEFGLGLARLYHWRFPRHPLGRTLEAVARDLRAQMSLWRMASAASATPPGRGTPQARTRRTEQRIEGYLQGELKLTDVAAVYEGTKITVTLRQDTLDPGTLRGRILAAALAGATFARRAESVCVVPHLRGVPIAALTMPAASVLALAEETLSGPQLLAACRARVFPDLFASGVPRDNHAARGGAGQFAYPAIPAPHVLAGTVVYPAPPPAPTRGWNPAAARPAVRNDYSNVTGDPMTDSEGFLIALCRCLLHREPTAKEIQDHAGLITRGLRRSQLITRMLVSDEYKARKTSNPDFVRDAYQAVLGREPVQAEQTMMGKFLTGGGAFERDMVIATLLSTAEYRQIRTQLRTKGPRARKKPEIKTVSAGPGTGGGGMQLYLDSLTTYNRLSALLGQTPNPAQAAVHAAWVHQARKDYDLALLRYQTARRRP